MELDAGGRRGRSAGRWWWQRKRGMGGELDSINELGEGKENTYVCGKEFNFLDE